VPLKRTNIKRRFSPRERTSLELLIASTSTDSNRSRASYPCTYNHHRNRQSRAWPASVQVSDGMSGVRSAATERASAWQRASLAIWIFHYEYEFLPSGPRLSASPLQEGTNAVSGTSRARRPAAVPPQPYGCSPEPHRSTCNPEQDRVTRRQSLPSI